MLEDSVTNHPEDEIKANQNERTGQLYNTLDVKEQAFKDLLHPLNGVNWFQRKTGCRYTHGQLTTHYRLDSVNRSKVIMSAEPSALRNLFLK